MQLEMNYLDIVMNWHLDINVFIRALSLSSSELSTYIHPINKGKADI